MTFGGIQKNSFIDFPGRISTVLFISGCNFSCPYCHNAALARGEVPDPITVQEAYAFLQQRKNFIEGVVISGGEPTLCKDIFDICGRIKSMGFPVKLDTNGSRPEILGRLLTENLIDYVAMDIKTDPAVYGPPLAPPGSGEKVIASIKLLMAGDLPYEFRTTCVAPFVSPAVMPRIGRWLKGARRYFLQPFRQNSVLAPAFFKENTTPLCDLETLQSAVSAFVPACRLRL